MSFECNDVFTSPVLCIFLIRFVQYSVHICKIVTLNFFLCVCVWIPLFSPLRGGGGGG